jgi:raffinose/stachyose/melibiose transport system substrate-binding protein
LMSKGIVVPAKVDMPADTSKYLKEMMALTAKGDAYVFDSIIPVNIVDMVQNGIQAITIKQTTPEQLAKDMQSAMDNIKK